MINRIEGFFSYRRARALATFFAALLLCTPALPASSIDPANTPAISKRPKICLVLSGGGARGAAHVGVIKVLEEYRIPIDCIAGTSMGALVGGAYASGASVAEMEDIMRSVSSELLFKETPPRQELSIRRKMDDNSSFIGPEIGVGNKGLGFAKGIVSGVQLQSVLRRLAKLKGYYNFDKLPIPFRAVATDLVTGKAVVFKEGDIANVMRASMSVPGAVAPAEFGGMMLVDGMLTSNLPVDAARGMKADIIIAVNVGTPLLKREQLNGIFGVTGQMLSILTEQNVQASIASLKPDDILIAPELEDFSTSDFDRLQDIAPPGEAAARKLVARLSALSLPPAEYAALRKRQSVYETLAENTVDEIRFENLRQVNPISVRSIMDTKAGQPVQQDVLDQDLRRIYGLGNFENVNYRFLEEPGRRVLAIEAVEKSWGMDTLRFGLGMSSDFKSDSFFNLLGSYRRYWLNSLGAEWRTDMQIGRSSGLTTEFYQPLNPEGSFFVAPHAGITTREQYVYQGDNRIASYFNKESLLGLDVGTVFRHYGELRFGVQRGTLDTHLDTGPTNLMPPLQDISRGAYTTRLVLDQMDNLRFPRSGWRSGLGIYNSASSLGADQPYTKWDGDASTAFSIDGHTFQLSGKVGGTLGSNMLPAYDQFQWGGFLQQSGYATGQLLGQSMKFGRLMYYNRIMKGTLLEGAYGGISLEAGQVDKPLVSGNPTGLLKSASLFIGVDSPIGPAYLGYGRAMDGNSSFYFYLGKPF